MIYNPLLTCPGVQERGRDLIHLSLRSNPQVSAYQFWAHRTVNDAYGNPLNSGVLGAGPTAIFTVNRGDAFRSPSLRRSGRGLIMGSIKGTTHAAFAGDDFAVPGGTVPPDEHWMFVRVQENRGGGLLIYAGGAPVLGPIYGVPPAIHFGTQNPSFTVFGTAPSSTGSVAGGLPALSEDVTDASPRAMHLIFPGWMSEVSIRNLSLVNLLVALGPDQSMRNIPAGGQVALTSGSATTREVLLACPDGVAGADFSLHAVSATGG